MNALAVGLTVPFMGTLIGASAVLFMRGAIKSYAQKALLGFASGVMVAASVWSLLMPSMALRAPMGEGWQMVMPAAVGFLLGMLFLLMVDRFTPHLHLGDDHPEGVSSHLSRTVMMALAVTIHNLPEGMAVGVVLAGAAAGDAPLSMAGVVAVATGIAIQNIPEGAIVALPLRAAGNSRGKAFAIGVLSGLVEPVGCALVVMLSAWLTPVLPYMLAFAAGGMMFVVIEELIPEASVGSHSNVSTVGFAIGFVLMMVLDVVLQ